MHISPMSPTRTLPVLVAIALMSGIAPAQDQYVLHSDLHVQNSEGMGLATDVYLPDQAGTFPVVFTRSPYDKRQFKTYLAEPLVKAGYAVVMQDVRGMNGSEGDFVPFIHEKQDGLDSLDWIAKQPWCNGNIGMWGPSYVGFCALVLAPEAHPNLKAIVNVSGWGDSDELVAPGGALHLMHSLPWTLSGQIRGKGSIRDIDWPTAFRFLPVNTIPESLGMESGPWTAAVSLFSGDILERVASMDGGYDRVTAPTLHMTGWYDFVARHTLDSYEGIDTQTDTPQRLIVGPWHHDQQWGDETVVGDEDFGPASIMGIERVVALSQQWFDRWLKEEPQTSTTDKPVRLFVMGDNEWREFEQWPPAGVEYQRWYLASDAAGGLLTMEPPDTEDSDSFTCDPNDPVPTTGGANSHFFRSTLGVRDQRALHQRKDLLIYTTPPFEHDVTIIGPLQAVLHAATQGRQTDFTAKLCEVRPDGFVAPLDDGIRRGPDALADGELMEPGKVYRFTIDMGATGIRIRKGHSLRVEIASSNFPKYSRNPNTGETPEQAVEFMTVEQTIMLSPAQPSYVVLPIVPER